MTAVDLAGHGDGPRLPAENGDLTTLVDAVVPRLPAGLTVLVGHSLGAVVALAVAAREPAVARGLVLEEPPGMAGGDPSQVADLSLIHIFLVTVGVDLSRYPENGCLT